MLEKKCKICGRILPLDSFYKLKRMKDGHMNQCKDCIKKRAIAYYDEHSKDEEWIKRDCPTN